MLLLPPMGRHHHQHTLLTWAAQFNDQTSMAMAAPAASSLLSIAISKNKTTTTVTTTTTTVGPPIAHTIAPSQELLLEPQASNLIGSAPAAIDDPNSIPPVDSAQLEGHTSEVKWVLTLVYLAIFLIGVIGNICNCLVIADSRNRYMKTATNYYLFSLSVSDLLLLIFGLPHDLVNLWHPSPYLFNQFVCISRGWISEASTYASVLVIVAFTVERYLAICHPLKAHTLSRLSRSIKMIVVIWLVASSCALVVVLQFGIQTILVNETVPTTASTTSAAATTSASITEDGNGSSSVAVAAILASTVTHTKRSTTDQLELSSVSIGQSQEVGSNNDNGSSSSGSGGGGGESSTSSSNSNNINFSNVINMGIDDKQQTVREGLYGMGPSQQAGHGQIQSQTGAAITTTRAIAQCTTVALNETIFELSVLMFFIVPMAVITILYVRLGYHLRQKTFVIKQSRQAREQRLHSNDSQQHHHQSAHRSASARHSGGKYLSVNALSGAQEPSVQSAASWSAATTTATAMAAAPGASGGMRRGPIKMTSSAPRMGRGSSYCSLETTSFDHTSNVDQLGEPDESGGGGSFNNTQVEMRPQRLVDHLSCCLAIRTYRPKDDNYNHNKGNADSRGWHTKRHNNSKSSKGSNGAAHQFTKDGRHRPQVELNLEPAPSEASNGIGEDAVFEGPDDNNSVYLSSIEDRSAFGTSDGAGQLMAPREVAGGLVKHSQVNNSNQPGKEPTKSSSSTNGGQDEANDKLAGCVTTATTTTTSVNLNRCNLSKNRRPITVEQSSSVPLGPSTGASLAQPSVARSRVTPKRHPIGDDISNPPPSPIEAAIASSLCRPASQTSSSPSGEGERLGVATSAASNDGPVGNNETVAQGPSYYCQPLDTPTTTTTITTIGSNGALSKHHGPGSSTDRSETPTDANYNNNNHDDAGACSDKTTNAKNNSKEGAQSINPTALHANAADSRPLLCNNEDENDDDRAQNNIGPAGSSNDTKLMTGKRANLLSEPSAAARQKSKQIQQQNKWLCDNQHQLAGSKLRQHHHYHHNHHHHQHVSPKCQAIGANNTNNSEQLKSPHKQPMMALNSTVNVANMQSVIKMLGKCGYAFILCLDSTILV